MRSVKKKLGSISVLLGLPLSLAASCTVSDKGDYTFDDNPSEGGEGATGGSTGGAGRGGAAGKGGAAGSAGSNAGRGGRGGSSGAAGSSGRGGSGNAGEAGSPEGGSGGAADQCEPNPCVHGDCTPDGDGYRCDCDDGYDGTRCQNNVDDCDPNPCQHGGDCEDGVDEYDCDCSGTGYTGSRCQTAVGTTCDDDPCVHGSCDDVSGGGFECDCAGTGYEGDVCDEDVDDCEDNPCKNGGRCSDTGANSFSCECTGGYAGDTCEDDADDCATNPCQNAGACRDTGLNSYICDCTGTGGFVGTNCECNAKVLFLDDGAEVENAAITAAMNAAGLTVTPVFEGAISYAGTPSAREFGAVVVIPGLSYTYDMQAEGQTAVVDAVTSLNIGYVTTEWSAYQVTAAHWATLGALNVLQRTSGSSMAEMTLTVGNPIWAGVPNTLSGFNLGSNMGAVTNGGVELATCPTCGTGGGVGTALAVREADGDVGRLVHWAHAASWSGSWTSYPDVTTVFVNSVRWATRCY